MKKVKYFIQFILIMMLFCIFKIIGIKLSLNISKFIFGLLGPMFRSNKITEKNLSYAYKNLTSLERKKIINQMWENYGKVFAEYAFMKQFRENKNFQKKIILLNLDVVEEIKKSSEPVIFISGHFNNFELMAMQIEKNGIDLAAIYRPLNNNFLNPIMENIRRKYICQNQIKKGLSGTKSLLNFFKRGTSIALMIDQRVSEGINSPLFNLQALTTTIPAQFVKKYNSKVVPVYIERLKENNFSIKFHKPIRFKKDESIETITAKLNRELETMILKNPDQWIWTHNRWK